MTAYDTDRTTARPSRRIAPLLILVLAAFVAGLLAMGYALTHWEVAARYLRPGAPAPVALAAPASSVPARPPIVVTPLPIGEVTAMANKVTDLEGRIAAIDDRARTASTNADRAEALLVAFAARRALDRGTALGYLEPLLRARFGPTQPQAVATIIAAARQPVTLDELRASLAANEAALLGPGPDMGWWRDLKREMAGLIVLRRANTPASQPADRLARAENAVVAGHVDRALVEVARLPTRDAAAGWIAAARRYVASRQALDAIETSALLAPRPAVPSDVELEPASRGERGGSPLAQPRSAVASRSAVTG